MTTRADLLASTALTQVGVTEDPPGSNCTPYGAEYGVNGVAWCCIFVWWCSQRAGTEFPTTAYVPHLEQWARDNGCAIPADQIRRGDVVCLDYTAPMGDGADHVEIALGPPVNGRIECVGGNTSDTAGGSIGNGGGVFTNSRPLAWVSTAIRLPRSDELIDPPPTPTSEDAMTAHRMNDGQIVLVSGVTFRVMSGDWNATINPQLVELGRAGLIPTMPDGTPIITAIGDNAINALKLVP